MIARHTYAKQPVPTPGLVTVSVVAVAHRRRSLPCAYPRSQAIVAWQGMCDRHRYYTPWIVAISWSDTRSSACASANRSVQNRSNFSGIQCGRK